MTKTVTTPAATTTATLELIDPASAVIDDNVRTNPTLTEEFVQQIREHGVRVPVLARRGDDGTVYVWDGQRRLLAARAAGLAQIHAIFSSNDSTTVARITDQLTSFNRDDLDKGDRVQAIAQLALEGISVDTIAKTIGTAKTTIASSIALAKSKTAREALDSPRAHPRPGALHCGVRGRPGRRRPHPHSGRTRLEPGARSTTDPGHSHHREPHWGHRGRVRSTGYSSRIVTHARRLQPAAPPHGRTRRCAEAPRDRRRSAHYLPGSRDPHHHLQRQ